MNQIIECARKRRNRKPLVRLLNFEHIMQTVWDIQEECENVRWNMDGNMDAVIDALDGNEDEAYEFSYLFSDLEADCDRLYSDLQEEYVSDYFDAFLVGIGASETFGGLIEWDPVEQDYFGIEYEEFAVSDVGKSIQRLTKKEILDLARHCFKIVTAYLSLQSRYDDIYAAMKILQGKNLNIIKTVKDIEEKYLKADAARFYEWDPDVKKFDELLSLLPQEMWI